MSNPNRVLKKNGVGSPAYTLAAVMLISADALRELVAVFAALLVVGVVAAEIWLRYRR